MAFTNVYSLLKCPNAFLVCCMRLVSMHDEWMSGAIHLDHFDFWGGNNFEHSLSLLCVCVCIRVCFLTHSWYTTMLLLSKSSSSIAYYHPTRAICFYVMKYPTYITQIVPYTIREQWDIPQCNTFSFHYLPFPQSQHMNAHLSWPHFSKLW